MGQKFVYIIELVALEKSAGISARKNFDCGSTSLNIFFQTLAKTSSLQNICQTHVLIEESLLKAIGYYSLSTSLATKGDIEEEKNFPYSGIPAMLIGRLAVDNSCKSRGYGRDLLMNAFEKIISISNEAGIRLITVDAADENAKSFYQKYGFKEFKHNPLKLYMSITTANILIQKAQDES